jgi:hypothetical protein
VIDEFLVDSELDMLTDFECECGSYLSIDYSGDLQCYGCGATYTVQTKIVWKEVN